MQHYFAFYADAVGRGVKFRVITEKPRDAKVFPKTMQSLWANPNLNLRWIRGYPKANVSILDKKEALVTIYPAASLAESPLVWTNHPSFIAIYQDHFETVWNSAREYEPIQHTVPEYSTQSLKSRQP
jgi:hypothetical protein